MNSFLKHLLAAIAGVAPSILVALHAVPGPVGAIAGGIMTILALRHNLSAPAKAGGSAGFVRYQLVITLAIASLVGFAGCALFRSAEANPADAFAQLKADSAKSKAAVDDFCRKGKAELEKYVPAATKEAEAFCADVAKAEGK